MEHSVPKRVFTLLDTKPNDEIYEICITLKNIHGAVAKTAKVLSEAHVNILTSILFDAVEGNNIGYWTSFIDLSRAIKDAKTLEEELRKLEVVQDVRVVKPEPLFYDIIHFPIIHGNSAALIMPVELFGSLFDEIEKILTPSGFAAVFYNAGKKSGGHIAKLFTERYGLKDDTLISALIQAARALGWGQITDLNVDRKELNGNLKIHDCFESRLRGHREDKVCHWTRGFVAGFLSKSLGNTVDVAESNCTAIGDSACEFEITPKIEAK